MPQIRPLELPSDSEGILALDISYDTDRIYEVRVEDDTIQLVDTVMKYSKKYQLNLDELSTFSSSHFAIVALIDSKIVGIAAAEFVGWNRRVVLHHLYVTRDYRGSGIGRTLLNTVTEWSVTTTARCLWVETQNTNYPAVGFYQSAGFSLCGVDTSLYISEFTYPPEIAIYLSKALV